MGFRKLVFAIVIAASSMLMISCGAETSLYTWKSPEATFDSVQHILVMGLIKDIEYRDTYERVVCGALNGYGFKTTKALNVLSPGKKYTDEELQEVIESKGIEGVLLMKYQGTKIEKTTAKGNTYTKIYKKFVSSTSGKKYIDEHKTVYMELSLYKASTGEVIWMGSAKTMDTDLPEDLAKSLAEELIKGFIKDGIIKSGEQVTK